MSKTELKESPETSEAGEGYERNGKTTIAPEVLLTIARLTVLAVPGVSRMSQTPGGVNRLFKRGYGEGVHLDIRDDDHVYADLYVILHSDVNIRDISRRIQLAVTRAITDMVGMPVGRVNVHIDDIDFPVESEA
ncbi:MAG TPA: Asp23/Gls24 family envelope stress response protein [Anaerolineales bacterium]|nr:Asp23/Gls24 family envelope stress response protein [Anaerolineales bacterium]